MSELAEEYLEISFPVISTIFAKNYCNVIDIYTVMVRIISHEGPLPPFNLASQKPNVRLPEANIETGSWGKGGVINL